MKYGLKTTDGSLYIINELQYGELREILSQKFSVRPDFYNLNEKTIIKINCISSISVENLHAAGIVYQQDDEV